MTALHKPEPSITETSITAPLAPPSVHLVRRSVVAVNSELAHAASTIALNEMRAKGMALIARSTRGTARGVVVDLVFAPRS